MEPYSSSDPCGPPSGALLLCTPLWSSLWTPTHPQTLLNLLVEPYSSADPCGPPCGALLLSRPTHHPRGHGSPVADLLGCTGGTAVTEMFCFQETFNQTQFQKSDCLILARGLGLRVSGAATRGQRDAAPRLQAEQKGGVGPLGAWYLENLGTHQRMCSSERVIGDKDCPGKNSAEQPSKPEPRDAARLGCGDAGPQQGTDRNPPCLISSRSSSYDLGSWPGGRGRGRRGRGEGSAKSSRRGCLWEPGTPAVLAADPQSL